MKLEEIIAIVDAAYPDGAVLAAFNDEDAGDTLAAFVASELRSIYDESASDVAQLDSVCDALREAVGDLAVVHHAILETIVRLRLAEEGSWRMRIRRRLSGGLM